MLKHLNELKPDSIQLEGITRVESKEATTIVTEYHSIPSYGDEPMKVEIDIKDGNEQIFYKEVVFIDG